MAAWPKAFGRTASSATMVEEGQGNWPAERGSLDYGGTWDREGPSPAMAKTFTISKTVRSTAGTFAARRVEQIRDSPGANISLFVLLPWALFAIVMSPFALALWQSQILASCVLVAATALSFMLWLVGQRATQAGLYLDGYYWRYLSSLCFLATLLGTMLGLYDYFRYVTVYRFYESSRTYNNVLPDQAPNQFADAGAFTFSADSFVDPTRSVGMMVRQRYCVAPIFDQAMVMKQSPTLKPLANFWAVGTDCCHSRGLFQCGPIADETVVSGFRVVDVSPLKGQERSYYMTAVREAASTYGLTAPDNAVLVQWTRSLDDMHKSFWWDGVHFYKKSVGIYLAIVVVLGLFAAFYWDGRSIVRATV